MDYLHLGEENKGRAGIRKPTKNGTKNTILSSRVCRNPSWSNYPAFSEVIAYNEANYIPVSFGIPDRVGLFLISHHPFFLPHPDHIHFVDRLE